MEGFSIPPTIFVALGVITAALLAGFFSFLNLVSAKENKVSEFRLAWVDGLRDEISIHTAAVQELLRIEDNNIYSQNDDLTDEEFIILRREWYKDSRETYAKVIENLTRIQLRLNKKHIDSEPLSHEAILMRCLVKSRMHFNSGEYDKGFDCCDEIRNAAAPLLKSTWDLVKNGEQGYQRVRTIAANTLIYGTVAVTVAFFALSLILLNQTSDEGKKYAIQNITLNIENLKTPEPKPTASLNNTGKITPSESKNVSNIANPIEH
ncbi:hypothetical protein FCH79_01255 [Pseudomonas koreensis]|uniref:hypothetical protein n=1 Tax=Pseudomonas koreensis TaxID=198620 RepID=UPI0015768896|nr:hypothetical protein [Pseudomonas koreensis]NTZ93953.1 hypothetical protein [Pseudomonas koreensis]